MVKSVTHEVGPFKLLRLDDDEITYFESLWLIPEGITYNAYLLPTSEGWVLFDTWKVGYEADFMRALKEVVNPSQIRYLVIHHMEPDHSGAVKAVLEENPGIEVLAHPMTKSMLESFYGLSPRFRAVRDGEEVRVGEYTLKFIYAPWLHWPETIFTYVKEARALLTCDAFGAYSIPPAIYDDELSDEDLEKYRFWTRKYMATVIGHYLPFVGKAIRKVRELGIRVDMILPSHGLIWRRPTEIMKYYEKWSAGETVSGAKKVVVVYGSMYGFVEAAVREAIGVLEEAGVLHRTYRFVDNHRDEISDLMGDLLNASGIILGTATYEAGIHPLMRFVLNLMIEKIPKNKSVLIITNYGWGGVAGKLLKKELETAGYRVHSVIEFRAGQLSTNRERIREAVKSFIEGLRGQP